MHLGRILTGWARARAAAATITFTVNAKGSGAWMHGQTAAALSSSTLLCGDRRHVSTTPNNCSRGSCSTTQLAGSRTASASPATNSALRRTVFSVPETPLAARLSPATKTTSLGPLSSKASLRQEQRKDFLRDGYLVVNNLFTPEEVAAIKDEIVAITRGRYGAFEGYHEANGLLNDDEVVGQYTRIDHLHKLSTKLTSLALAHPKIVEVLTNLIGPNIKCMSTKLHIHGHGDAVKDWHQDESTIATRDRSLLSVLIALDPQDQETGCLWTQPGSHRTGILYKLEKRRPTAAGTAGAEQQQQQQHQGATNDGSAASSVDASASSDPTSASGVSDSVADTFRDESQPLLFDERYSDPDSCFEDKWCEGLFYEDELDGVPIELTPGSVVLVHGYTLQKLLPFTPTSNSRPTRQVLKASYASCQTWLPWTPDPSVPAPADNRDFILIAGKDPYAYKGPATGPFTVPRALRSQRS